MIPRTRPWIVTLEDGRRYVVLAPTRVLARLNFRAWVGYDSIRSIGVARKDYGHLLARTYFAEIPR